MLVGINDVKDGSLLLWCISAFSTAGHIIISCCVILEDTVKKPRLKLNRLVARYCKKCGTWFSSGQPETPDKLIGMEPVKKDMNDLRRLDETNTNRYLKADVDNYREEYALETYICY